ncbi:hypothetical protein Sme01_13920 [Sphaerisporangium melleum]|uniref:Uncharacterized protein n=1 Tax=Sphaerisporangium melleum TaxID=321316 RepID=A0A917QU84_9ACTN|nr:hypothetical protein [Sphaerisporangium melleum]GGK68656.1 hypothetical protein GCM10007964_09530 [Sphaerisporangium melleum]GII68916.1 hypothetical protein Sme01_13920 [Sphaerisporangium melleum]
MDPGHIVVVIFGVAVVAAVLGVALVTIVLRGIRGEPMQWPVAPDRRAGRAAIEGRDQDADERACAAGEHPEWTGKDLAGDDLRPVGTHPEKRVLPGRAHWW